MSLGRPSPSDVNDQARLLKVLTGLYDAINGNRTAISNLETRVITVTDNSVTNIVGASSPAQASPLSAGDGDEHGSPGPAPGGGPGGSSMARVWVSTADPSQPYAVNMGALGDGVLRQVTAVGVSTPSVFSHTANRIPFGSGVNGWTTDSANFTYDDATGTVLVGLTSASAVVGVTMEVFRNQNAGTQFVFANSSAGASAYAAFQLGQSSNLATGAYFGMTLLGTGASFGGEPYTPGAGVFSLGGGTNNLWYWIQQNVGDHIWATKTTFPNPPEKMRLTTDGQFGVGNSGTFPTGAFAQFNRNVNGATYTIISNANAGTGAEAGLILSQSATSYTNYLYMSMLGAGYTTSGPYQASGGAIEHVTNTTAPLFLSAYGSQPIDFYTTTSRTLRLKVHNAGTVEVVSQLHVDVGAEQVWRNLGVVGAGTYEQVRAFWSSDTWVLATEASGGTERNMILGNATNATVGVTSGTSAYLQGGAAGAPAVGVSSLGVGISAATIRTSSAGATLDAISVVGSNISVTGSTNITTALGFNYIKIAAPTLTGTGGAKTISIASTMVITGAPVAAGDVTITVPMTFWVQGGRSRFDGHFTGAGAGSNLGFFGFNGAAMATVTGARGGNAALASLLTALAGYNLITDSTTP